MAEHHDRRGCAVCGRALDYVVGGGWRHTMQDQPEDHPAVPVSVEEIELIGRCDFCNTDFPGWVVPARDFQTHLPQAASGGNWAACDTCADMVRNKRWDALLRRASKLSAERNGLNEVMLRSRLQPFYNRLRKNVSGPVERIQR